MSSAAEGQRKQWMRQNVKRTDNTVVNLPGLRTVWHEIRPLVVQQIQQVPANSFMTTKWPPLFLWLSRYPGEASALEDGLMALKGHGGGEFKHACSQLGPGGQSEQAYSRIVELTMIGRCLYRSVTGTVDPHPRVNLPGRRRADLAVTVGNKRIYVEVTVLCEKPSRAAGGPRSYSRTLHPPREGGRILGKILDKVSPKLDIARSQLSASAPNALILCLVGHIEEAYDEALEWALGALDLFPGRIYQAVAKRNSRRERPLSDSQIGGVIDAFSRISCVLAFRDCLFWTLWWRPYGPQSLTGGYVRRLIALFH